MKEERWEDTSSEKKLERQGKEDRRLRRYEEKEERRNKRKGRDRGEDRKLNKTKR